MNFFEMIQKALLGEEMIITDEHRSLVRIVPLSPPGSRREPGSGTGQPV